MLAKAFTNVNNLTVKYYWIIKAVHILHFWHFQRIRYETGHAGNLQTKKSNGIIYHFKRYTDAFSITKIHFCYIIVYPKKIKNTTKNTHACLYSIHGKCHLQQLFTTSLIHVTQCSHANRQKTPVEPPKTSTVHLTADN